MAKKKNEDFFSELAGATGGQTLREAGRVPYYVDTGNLALNYQSSGRFITGGFPGGRIIESFGPEASGKSLIGHCFLGNIQRMGGIAILLDCERSAGAEFAERCGHVNPDQLMVWDSPVYERIEKKLTTVIPMIRKSYPTAPIGIVWDSIGVTMTEREWNELNLPENATKAQIKEAGGNERPGERARMANSVLRKLNPFLNDNNATLYVINQLRQKIGVMFGNPETTNGGGEAIKYYASLRIRCNSPKSFQDKDTDLPLGVNMSVTNKKNRHNTPGIRIDDVPLFFNGGIHPLGGLLQALVLAKRVTNKPPKVEGEVAPKKKKEEGEKKEKSSNVYTVLEPYANGDPGTFKLAANATFDPEVLYRWPALVDAKNADQVKKYLEEWSEAMQLASSEDVVQVKVTGDNADEALEHILGQVKEVDEDDEE